MGRESMILTSIIVIVGLLIFGLFAFSPGLAKSTRWQATLTPLASIMGSGFLVSAPLLAGIVGVYAVFCMFALLVLAYSVGSAVRFNIQYFEPIENDKGLAQNIAFLSRIILSAAYFISITYYLQLLAAFVLRSFDVDDPFIANVITTSLLIIIGVVGMWRGLSTLEKVEKYAVSLNLGMVGALLVGLVYYNISLLIGGEWHIPSVDSTIELRDIQVLLGLLIVVQGFETSRYLGSKHPAEERISSMKMAQIVSSLVYISFVSLATVLFHSGLGSDVTAIIGLVAPISLVLPALLTVAAVVSQFSASVADTAGASGLVQEITHNKIPIRNIYFIVLCITVVLTWATNVNEIIVYASRAFALFYSFQCCIAFVVAKKNQKVKNRKFKLYLFFALTLVCLLVFVFGVSSE